MAGLEDFSTNNSNWYFCGFLFYVATLCLRTHREVYKDAFAPPPPSRVVKAWERAPRKATAPRLQGQKVWKRPGLRSRDNKENDEAVQTELLKGGAGSRKRARIQGVKENISDPKWLENSEAGDVTEDALGVAEEKIRLSMTCNGMDGLQMIPRKRTNANHVITPRKPLQKRSSSEANQVLSPIKLLLSPAKPEKRRKSARKSLRRISILIEDIQSTQPRRESLRQSAVFDMSSLNSVPELPTAAEGTTPQVITPSLKLPIYTADVSIKEVMTEPQIEESVDASLQSALERDAQFRITTEVTGNVLAATEPMTTKSRVPNLMDDEEPVADEVADGCLSAPAASILSVHEIAEGDKVFGAGQENIPGIRIIATSTQEPATTFSSRSPEKSTAITTPIRATRPRRPATEKPSTRLTTRVTRRSLRQPEFPVVEKISATNSKTPMKKATSVRVSPTKPVPIHDSEFVGSEDEAIHQQLFACPSPRETSHKESLAGSPAPIYELSANEVSRGRKLTTNIIQPNPQEEACIILSSENPTSMPTENTEETEESSEAGKLVDVPFQVVQVTTQLDAQTPAAAESILCDNHPRQNTLDGFAMPETNLTGDDSVLSNDPFMENLSEDSVLSNENFDEAETTLESLELLEPLTTTLTANNSVAELEDQHAEEPSEDVTIDVTIDVTVDATQKLKSANYDHDDTDVLFNFLTRVKADKAAKADKAPTRRKRSFPHSPLRLSLGDEGVDELASPEVVYKDPFDVSLPRESPNKRRKTCEAPQGDGNVTEPQSFRRSARTRLPVIKSSLPAPNFISIARSNGDTTINLKKDHDKELAALTRNNTRKNKGAALHPQVVLAKQACGKGSPASRHKALKEVFDEKAQKKTEKKKKSVVWAEELTHFQGIEKKEAIAATVEKRVELVKMEKKSDPVKEPERLREEVVSAEEKKEVKKSSIPRVSMRSKIALGMAVNGTPARKMRKRL
jgi:hypothetical protein